MLPRDCDAGLPDPDHCLKHDHVKADHTGPTPAPCEGCVDAPWSEEETISVSHGMTLYQAHDILSDACPGCKHFVEATSWSNQSGKIDDVVFTAVVYPAHESGLKSAGAHMRATLLDAVRDCIDDAITKGLCGENKRLQITDPARRALLGD